MQKKHLYKINRVTKIKDSGIINVLLKLYPNYVKSYFLNKIIQKSEYGVLSNHCKHLGYRRMTA